MTSTFKFDSTDFNGMRKLMSEVSNGEYPYNGKNEDGEDISISVFRNHITTCVHQSNGVARYNIYWEDGTTEEWYDR